MSQTAPAPCFDAADPVAGEAFGDLPEWRLDDLYPGMDSAPLKADLAWLKTEMADYAATYEGKLADLSSDDLLAAVQPITVRSEPGLPALRPGTAAISYFYTAPAQQTAQWLQLVFIGAPPAHRAGVNLLTHLGSAGRG